MGLDCVNWNIIAQCLDEESLIQLVSTGKQTGRIATVVRATLRETLETEARELEQHRKTLEEFVRYFYHSDSEPESPEDVCG
jgi:hypothetical protein